MCATADESFVATAAGRFSVSEKVIERQLENAGVDVVLSEA